MRPGVARGFLAALTVAALAATPPRPAIGAETAISLGANTILTKSVSPVSVALGSGSGLTFKTQCVDLSGTGTTAIRVLMALDSGQAQFAYTSGSVTGAASVIPGGDAQLFEFARFGQLNGNELLPLTVTVAKSDGTFFHGVISVGVDFTDGSTTTDCLVNGLLLPSLKKSPGFKFSP